MSLTQPLLNFGNVELVPGKCVVFSRRECDVTVLLGQHRFRLPLVPANMTTIIDVALALALAREGYFYVLHRFRIDPIAFVRRCRAEQVIASISLGVKTHDYEVVDQLVALRLIPDYITIDVAHGHSDRMRAMITYVRKHMPATVFIIAGNIATPRAALDLEEWGADGIKVGIGPGYVCTTLHQTGFGTARWELTALSQIFNVCKKPLILDGGLRSYGDIAKAIRFGAVMCMSGYLLSCYPESPGKTVVKDGKQFKQYYGSASFFNKHTTINIEGDSEWLPLKPTTIWTGLDNVRQALQSSLSYAGGKQLCDLRKVEYVVVSS